MNNLGDKSERAGAIRRKVDKLLRTKQETSDLRFSKTEILKAGTDDRYCSLLNNLDVGIIVHGPDTSILISNPRATELLGLSEEQLRGKLAIDPNWKFFNEDYSLLSLEKYPVNQILSSKRPIKNFIGGVKRPK